MLESENEPLIPVISKACGYFASVAEPYVNTTVPLTPGPVKSNENVSAATSNGYEDDKKSVARKASAFFIVTSSGWLNKSCEYRYQSGAAELVGSATILLSCHCSTSPLYTGSHVAVEQFGSG